MLWISYSCMIVFFGAEFTKQLAAYKGRKIEPAKNAVRMPGTASAKLLVKKQEAVEKV